MQKMRLEISITSPPRIHCPFGDGRSNVPFRTFSGVNFNETVELTEPREKRQMATPTPRQKKGGLGGFAIVSLFQQFHNVHHFNGEVMPGDGVHQLNLATRASGNNNIRSAGDDIVQFLVRDLLG
jgi:hypothetical protein